jgi:hypothetical protein
MSNDELEFFDHDVTENVTRLLTKYSRTKDDDMLLVATYYYTYYPNLVKLTAMDFLKKFAESKLVSSDLITRTRRKLQEHNPELRGTKWKERHHKQAEVKSDLRKVDQFRNSI